MSRAELVHVDVTDLAANRRDEEPTGTGVDNDREAVSLSVEPAHSLQPEESSQTAELDDAVAIEIPDQTQEQLEGSSGAPIPPPYSLNVPPPLTAPLGPGTSPDAQTHVGGNQHFDIATVLAMHRGINDKAFSQLAEGTEILHISEDTSTHSKVGLECTICLDALEEGQMTTRVPCTGKHVFHHECLNTWMATKLFHCQPAFCPNCNFKILDPLQLQDVPQRPPPRAQVTPVDRRRAFLLMIFLILVVVVCAFMIPRIFGIHRHRWNRDRDEREAESKDRSDRRRLLVTVGEAHATLRADMTLERDVRVPLRKARARPGRIEARAVIDSAHWAR